MPNESGFIDYSQYAALNGNDEERHLQEAMAAAEAQDSQAAAALRRSQAEAERAALGGGAQDITTAASYSDYLIQKQKAAKAWQAAKMTGSDPRMAALRGAINQRRGLDERADKAAAGLDAREAQANDVVGQTFSGNVRLRSEQAARDEAAKAAAEKRKQEGDAARVAYIQALVKGASGRAGAGGARTNYVGSYNPNADSLWAQQQGGYEAARLLQAGGTTEQAQGIWNQYNDKGRYGVAPKNPQGLGTQTYNRETDVWGKQFNGGR